MKWIITEQQQKQFETHTDAHTDTHKELYKYGIRLLSRSDSFIADGWPQHCAYERELGGAKGPLRQWSHISVLLVRLSSWYLIYIGIKYYKIMIISTHNN